VRRWRYASAYRQEARNADVVYVASLGLPRPGPRRPTVLRVPGDRAWERAINRRWVSRNEDIDRFQRTRYGIAVQSLKWFRSRETQLADRVIVPSQYLRDMVIGWGVDAARVSIVYSAVNDPRPPTPRGEARRMLGWPCSDRRLLTVARLTPWKGVDLLIDAVARIPGVTLVVVGDGPERQALVDRAARRRVPAEFIGAVSRERLRILLSASDYAALYSGYEGLSHTILESLQAGTPVIASRRGGNPEVVQPGVNGFLVDHPDPEALVKALERAFAAGTREMLAANTRTSLDRFDWASAGPSLVEAIEATARLSS
jgi:glycosyltransferase involved in cell wall biosynthesis